MPRKVILSQNKSLKKIRSNPDHPPCPYCYGRGRADSSRVRKNGFGRTGQRRYLCGSCGRSFEGNRLERNLKRRCGKCGSPDCRKEHSLVYCKKCSFHFPSGGHEDLHENLQTLISRVESLNIPRAVKEEVLQNATLSVLERNGNCKWVHLDVSSVMRDMASPMRVPFLLRKRSHGEDTSEIMVNPGRTVVYRDGYWVSTELAPMRGKTKKFE